MKKLIKHSLVASALSLCFAANAEVRINGFANLVAGTAGSDESFLGYDDEISFDAESLFSLQISGDINEKMSATGQIVARGANDYEAEFEWAYIAYKLSDKATLTAGRFRLPLFTFSASKDVGYSHHWINPPSAVYDVPFNNLDGVKADYATYAGDWEFNFTGAFGTFDNIINNGALTGARTIGNNTVLFSAEAIYDAWKLRGVVGRTTTTINLLEAQDVQAQQLGAAFDTIAQLGLVELANSLKVDEDTGEFLGVSIQYDNFDWFFGAEMTTIDVADSFTNADDAYFLTLGKRFGKWTPSITYESLESDGTVKNSGLIAGLGALPLPAEVIGQLQAAAVGSQLTQEEKYNVVSLTMRYDLDTSIALKADISKISDDVSDANDATTIRFAVNYVF
jgi:hypothetical protein